ncbi:MAG: peptidoglycan bridge formation glycyltransferase FemA/FemB family protein, partial [Bacteroidetes bacterium]|nr:peptidoglycan bridge formation glycyltransferase FemA/FemB family protein [Bacteroidota bacterium]
MSKADNSKFSFGEVMQYSKKQWDEFVYHHPFGSFLQTGFWANQKDKHGWKSKTIIVDDGEKIISGVNILYKNLPLVGKYIYIPRGPVVNWENKD